MGEPPRVLHAVPLQGSGKTPCCGKRRVEIPSEDGFTLHGDSITCAGNGILAADSIVHREAALSRRAGEALQRLLQVRERVNRASSSVINADFRNELLELIDRGSSANR